VAEHLAANDENNQQTSEEILLPHRNGPFHNYSFGNILEIARQKPDATRVAGMYAWNQLGRKVIPHDRDSEEEGK
jgi:hypothetical protein